jgi:hypothetical protein
MPTSTHPAIRLRCASCPAVVVLGDAATTEEAIAHQETHDGERDGDVAWVVA